MSHSSLKPPRTYSEVCRSVDNNPILGSASRLTQATSHAPIVGGSKGTTGTPVANKRHSTAHQRTDGRPISLNSKASRGTSTSTVKPATTSRPSFRPRRIPSGSPTVANTKPSDAIPAIHRLPLELLIQVFRSFIEMDRGAGWISQDRVLKLSIVCRHWRSVVYATPPLWCTISSYYQPARLKKAIELSKEHLLDVHWVTEPFAETSTSIQTLLAVMGSTRSTRWRSLQGRMSTRNLVTLCRGPAPSLEELDLVLDEVRSHRHNVVSLFHGVQLFQASMDKLRHLKLQWSAQYFTLSWESMVFPALEFLHLTTANHAAAPSSIDLLDFLRRSTKLRDLELNLPNKLESPNPTNDDGSTDDVHLPSLRKIHLMSNSSYASNLLSRLRFPSSAIMDITITLDPKQPYPTSLIQHAAPQLVSAAKQVAGASRSTEQPKIDLMLDHHSIVLQVGHSSSGTKKNKKELIERPLFYLRIFGSDSQAVERALRGLGTVLSTTAIDAAINLDVTFDRIAQPDASTSFKAVARLPRVTGVQIGVTEGSTPSSVDQFLKFLSQNEPASIVSPCPFPEMDKLTIGDADPSLLVEAVKLRYKGFVSGRRAAATGSRKASEVKPLKSLTTFWKNRVAGEYESLREPVVKILGVNRVLWWYDSGVKGVWQ